MDPLTLGAIGATGVAGFLGANAAANAQNQASTRATEEQHYEFGIQNENERPYREAGYNALGQIQNSLPTWNKPFTIDDFKANMDPAYQFNLEQGQKAIQNSAVGSRGLVNAGTLAALSNYSQNQASNEYGNAFNRYQTQINNSYNRLASLAGLGQTAVTNTNSAAQNAGNNISSNIIGAGNAQAAGIVGGTNALTSAAGLGLNQYNSNQWMNKMFPEAASPMSSYSAPSQAPNYGGVHGPLE